MNIYKEDHLRSGMYVLLGGLLRKVPEQDLLNMLAGIEDVVSANGSGPLGRALAMLKLAGNSVSEDALEHEYHTLFIGLGRGELVPFASWYMTGYLMEKPLGILRQDLKRLGFERQEGVHEPEDHAAALCEVMAMLIESEEHSESAARNFFTAHLEPWMGRFFSDLEQSENACFYRAVGSLGTEFFQFEKRYLSMPA